MPASFRVVVPVKGTVDAKSRLDGSHRLALARAMALDTVEAALSAPGVREVIVVTAPALAADFAALGATVVDDPGLGLTAAIERGLEQALDSAPELATAVLLGDLPGLDPTELGAALAAAADHRLALVADADGVGTVLATALPGAAHGIRFGADSRRLHLEYGYVELDGDWPTLRRDVDTAAHLDAVARPGARTARLLGASLIAGAAMTPGAADAATVA